MIGLLFYTKVPEYGIFGKGLVSQILTNQNEGNTVFSLLIGFNSRQTFPENTVFFRGNWNKMVRLVTDIK